MRSKFGDRFSVYILSIVLAVLSIGVILNVRHLEETIRKQDLIAECMTPGSRCYKLSLEQAEARRKQATAENKCLIIGALEASNGAPLGQILINFDTCVTDYLAGDR